MKYHVNKIHRSAQYIFVIRHFLYTWHYLVCFPKQMYVQYNEIFEFYPQLLDKVPTLTFYIYSVFHYYRVRVSLY